MTLDFDIAYSHARFTEDDPAGNYIPGSVETVIATGATIDLPNGLFGSLRTRYFGPRPLIEDNSVRSKSTTLVNLEPAISIRTSGRRLMSSICLILTGTTSTTFMSHAPGEPIDGIADVHFHPVEPRTVRFYLTYRF